MRPLWKDILAGLIMGLVVPWILLNFAAAFLVPMSDAQALVFSEWEVPETTTANVALEIPVMKMQLLLPEGQTTEMEMDAYLVRVLLAEMPAYFEMEALKAQAVVARTYSLKAQVTGGKHGGGCVCTRAECCQAYITEEDYLKSGGTEENVEKIRRAVEDTSGYVLLYEGEPIEATYFSCSGGRTEDASAVWGTDFPYLRAVNSPGEEHATHYTDSQIFSKEAFLSALGIQQNPAGGNLLGTATYTAGGGIEQMTIGEKVFTGTQLRQLLGLRSTAITMEEGMNTITVTTMGFGHRVGMSQYGADAMAAAGDTFDIILAHYYQGTELSREYHVQ